MRILFVTRTYPPLVGGMEKFASDFYNSFQQVGDIDLLPNRGGKKTIVFFLFRALVTITLNSRKYDVIHLYDAVLFPLIPFIRLFSKARISLTVNGLDIVYSFFGYQKLMPFFLNMADRVFTISRYTMLQCQMRGISKEKLETIPVGINLEHSDACLEQEKNELYSRFNIPSDRKILLTVGRLVKRKGHSWFIRHVLVRLPNDYIYMIAGLGPETVELKNLVHELKLTSRVYLLGQITDKEKDCLYQIADLFIMPNITVQGDQEGFGIVLLEAGMYGLPVIASNIEGIKDAVIEGQTGRLIDERETQGFVDAIINNRLNPATITKAVALSYDWKNISKRYKEAFEKMIEI